MRRDPVMLCALMNSTTALILLSRSVWHPQTSTSVWRDGRKPPPTPAGPNCKGASGCPTLDFGCCASIRYANPSRSNLGSVGRLPDVEDLAKHRRADEDRERQSGHSIDRPCRQLERSDGEQTCREKQGVVQRRQRVAVDFLRQRSEPSLYRRVTCVRFDGKDLLQSDHEHDRVAVPPQDVRQNRPLPVSALPTGRTLSKYLMFVVLKSEPKSFSNPARVRSRMGRR